MCNLHSVVLGERTCQFVPGLISKIKKNVETSRYVTYVSGDPRNVVDLDRARIKEASAAFFLPNKVGLSSRRRRLAIPTTLECPRSK